MLDGDWSSDVCSSDLPVPSLKAAAELLAGNGLDAYATNKGILYELSDRLPGSRVLGGRWGLESLAIAVPRGRDAGLPYLDLFALTVRRDGTLHSVIVRAGLRGTSVVSNP
jgi:polar amino acid transport system substrate-binding protein